MPTELPGGFKKRSTSVIVILSAIVATVMIFTIFNVVRPLSDEAALAQEVRLAADPSLEGSLVRIDDVRMVNSDSKDPSALVTAEQDGLGVEFFAENKGATDTTLNVIRWDVSVQNPAGSIIAEESTTDNTKADVSSGERVPIYTLDLAKNAEYFELWPGEYFVQFRGIGPAEVEKCGADSCEKIMLEQTSVFEAKVQVSVAYDADKIRENLGILRTAGMTVGIAGDGVDSGRMFKIGANETKNMILYIYNEGNGKISALENFSIEGVWNIADRANVAGYNTYRDYEAGTCESIEPGGSKSVSDYNLSYDTWPLGGEGIAKGTGDNVTPGIYIAAYEVTTSPCTSSDGSEIPGGSHRLMVAFEVD